MKTNLSPQDQIVIPIFDLKSLYQTVLKSLFTAFLMLCSMGVSGQATLPVSTTALSKLSLPTAFSQTGLGTDYGEPSLKFDDKDDSLILNFIGIPATLTFDVGVNGTFPGTIPNDATFTVEESVTGIIYTSLGTYSNVAGGTKVLNPASTTRYIRWIYSTKPSGTNIALKNIGLTVGVSPIISITSGKWSEPSTWTDSTVPTSADNVIIAAGHVVTMDTAIGGINTRNSGTTTTVNSGGTLATDVTYTNNGTTTINGNFQINAGGYATGSDFVYNETTSTLIFNHRDDNVYGPINVNHKYWPTSGPRNVTVNTKSPINLGVSRVIGGNFQTAAGVTLSSSTLSLNGIAQINAGGFFNQAPTYGAASKLVYNTGSTDPYHRGLEWSANVAGLGYPNAVHITGNSTLDFPSTGPGPFSQALGIAKNLTIDSGSSLFMDYGLNNNKSGSLTIGGDLINEGNLVLGDAIGGDLYISGNWTKSGSGTFNPNSRAVFFNGSSAQTITGATTFDYLTINSSAGVTLASNVVNNLTLNLLNGKLTLGANDLTIGIGGTITNASATKYIVTNGVGKLIKNAVSSTAFNFPIGLNITNYTPVSVANTAGTSDLSVNVVSPIVNAVTDNTKVVNLQWNINSSAATTATVSPVWISPTNQGLGFTNTGIGELGNYISPNYTIYPVALNTTTTTATNVALQSGTNAIVVANTGAIFTNPAAYFKSNVSTGDWATPASWQYSTDNATWSTSLVAPTSSALAITILTGNTITVGTTATAKDLAVNAGGVLTVNSTLTIAGTTNINGTWNQTMTSTLTNSGTLSFNANSIYNNNVSNGTIPIATWNATSSCNITGYNNSSPVNFAGGIGQTFGNLTFNNDGSRNYINLFSATGSITVNGTLTVGPSNNNQVSFNNTGGTVTAIINNLNITGGTLNGVGSSATVNLSVANNMTISGYGIFRNSSSSGTTSINVNNDLILNDNGLVQVVGGSGTTVPNQSFNVGRDLTISGIYAQLNLKPNASSSATATVNVGRNFSSNNTDTNAVDVEFGKGTVADNAIFIKGNLTHTGAGVYQTSSSSQSRGFVLTGTAIAPSQISYTGTDSDYTSYEVATSAFATLNTDLKLGSYIGPTSYFTALGNLNFNNKSIVGNNEARFITAAGATLASSNSAGLGGTTATGSLKYFTSTDVTSLNGRAQFIAGINYIFKANTNTPFPTGTFGNPASLTFNNANVLSNRTGNMTVSGAVDIKGSSTYLLNSASNNLTLGGVMTIDPSATFDNNGENQIINGGGSIVVNGTFITRDVQGFTGTNAAIPGITPTLGANSTIVFGRNGDQDVTNFTTGYKNITFAGSGIKTVNGAGYSISETITINNGAVLDAKSVGFGGTGTKLTMLGNSLFKTGGGGTKPDASGLYTLDTNSTIEFQGTSVTEIAVSKLYEKIIVSGNNVKPSGLNLTVNQNTTLTSTGKLTLPSTNDNASSTVFNAKKGIVVDTDGQLIFKNNAQLMQDSNASNSGAVSMERIATIPVSTFNQYVYWSSPVIGQNYKDIFPGNPTSALYHNETNNKFYTSSGAYIAGRSLAVRNPIFATGSSSPLTASMKGTPYNADLDYALNFTDESHGYNLVGNPYPSNLNLNDLYIHSTNIESTFLFWDNTSNIQQSQKGDLYEGYSYAKYNAATGSGTGIPAPGNGAPASNNLSKTPNNILKVGQGFMVRATGSGAKVAFKHADRITSQTAAQFYGKAGDSLLDDRYFLEFVTPENLVFTNAVVYFENGENYYAAEDSKFESSVSEGMFTQAEDEKVVINGRSSFLNSDVIKVGSRQFATGLYKIRLGAKEGIFANGQKIYLKDIQTGIFTNLSEGNYTFAANAGESTGRFEIVYVPQQVLGTSVSAKENIKVYREGQDFVVQSSSKIIDEVEVFDVSGRLMQKVKANSTKVLIDGNALVSGVYLLKIKRNNEIISKKIIK